MTEMMGARGGCPSNPPTLYAEADPVCAGFALAGPWHEKKLIRASIINLGLVPA